MVRIRSAVVVFTVGLIFEGAVALRPVSADVGPRLTPFSWRGGAMLALLAVSMAVIVVAMTFLRKRRDISSRGQKSETHALKNSDRSKSDRTRLRSVVSATLQVLIGVLIVVGLTGLARQTILSPDLPTGWSIIRPPNEVTTLAESDGTIWAGGRAGLWAIDRHTNELLPLPDDRQQMKRVRDLLVDSEGVLWIAHQQGLTSFDGRSWKDHSGTKRLAPGPAYALLEDKEGYLWVGTDQGPAFFDGDEWHAYTTKDGLATADVTFIYQDDSGSIWFGSDDADAGGLSRYDGQEWVRFSMEDGLVHNSINAIYQDARGDIWFATGFGHEGGATRLQNGQMISWTQEDGLAGGKVRSIYEDEVGRLWFGSEYDGMAVFDGESVRILTPKDGVAGWEVKHMIQDSDGVYWLGTENGLSRIDSYEQ